MEVTEEQDRALRRALFQRDGDVARALVDAGADPARLDAEGRGGLEFAALGGDPDLVRWCLDLGADPTHRDAHGLTAVSLAAGWGHPEAVRVLVEAGADLEVVGDYGGTPLVEASRLRDHPDTVATLVELGAEVDAADPADGRTALWWASQRGHVELVSVLLDAGADPGRADTNGITPLMRAASGSHASVAQALLDAGAAVDARDGGERPAVSWAAQAGSDAVLRALADAGATFDVVDADGASPLSLACSGASADTVRFLLKHVSRIQPEAPLQRPAPLLAALSREDPLIQDLLLADPRTDVDYRSGPTGGTALFWAAAHGQVASARRLLDAGADPAIPDVHGRVAVQAAAAGGVLSVLQVFAERGISLRPPGEALLVLAAGGSSSPVRGGSAPATVAWLLERESAPSDVLGRALVRAAGRADAEVVGLLLGAGADPDASEGGRSALECAVAWPGREDRYRRPVKRKDDPAAAAVEALLEAGADPAATVKDGSILAIARGMRCDPIVRLLEKRGAR